jgi:toxin ParE1/3/4
LRVVLAPSARNDLAELWSYIALDDPKAADRIIERVVEGLKRLGAFPLSGRPRDELAAGVRSYFVRPRYTVFYRIADDRLEVIHILHHARDLSRFFPDER